MKGCSVPILPFLVFTICWTFAPMNAQPKITAIAGEGSNLYAAVFQYDPPLHLSSFIFFIKGNSRVSIPLPPYLAQYQIQAIVPIEGNLLVVGEWSVEGPLPLRVAILDADRKWRSFGEVDCTFFDALSQGPSHSVRIHCRTEADSPVVSTVRNLNIMIPPHEFPQRVAGKGKTHVVNEGEALRFSDGRRITAQSLISNGVP